MSLTAPGRRLVYLFVLLALGLPLAFNYSIPPAQMEAAGRLFDLVSGFEKRDDKIAFVALDFGPNIIAENGPQAEVVIEHLMRRRIPVALFSLYVQAEPFLNIIPERVAERLMAENPGERWVYGVDWVNLGYRPGGFLVLQAIPKSQDLISLFGTDARGTKLGELPAFNKVHTLENIGFLYEVTGLVGMFEAYVQFFQNENYRPQFGHGCTSITIPQAFIYLDSGQLSGLLEGIAGAAWYSKLLRDEFPERRADPALVINTGLGVAHLVIIGLVLYGNLLAFRGRKR